MLLKNDASESVFSIACPQPFAPHTHIQLAHGGGGRYMRQLIESIIVPTLYNDIHHAESDAALQPLPQSTMAITTDSYVVNPLVFPGGSIGTLAINGTVNDLAMAGAIPTAMTIGLIIEEGLKITLLHQLLKDMRKQADTVGISIVTGDTKVVERGKGDGLYINTTGIGAINHTQVIHPSKIARGDCIIINGDIGRHGISVMAQRDNLDFETRIKSDCAPLSGIVNELISANVIIHCMRDVTRGGLASILNELVSHRSEFSLYLEEDKIPVLKDIESACELLGLDPLYVACEGRFVAFVPPNDAEKAVAIMRKHPHGKNACIIGEVISKQSSLVLLRSILGTTRPLDLLSGEQLPRIC